MNDLHAFHEDDRLLDALAGELNAAVYESLVHDDCESPLPEAEANDSNDSVDTGISGKAPESEPAVGPGQATG
jgi:hypothetical protein